MWSRWLLLAAVAVAVLVADQLTKWWALERLAGDPIDVIWTLRFRLTFNTGAAFSFGGGYGTIIGVVAIVVVGVLLWQGRRITSRLGAVAIGMVVGGALGNLVDRAFRGDGGFFSGAVVDFVDLGWWPVFNVADAAVVIGAILIVVQVAFARSEP